MVDPFGAVFSSVSDPGERATAVVPGNTDFAETPKAIYVGTGGDVAMIGDNEAPGIAALVWKNVPSGAIIPFRPRRIVAAGTTATDMLAIY